MKIIKTYENYNLPYIDLGEFEERIEKSKLISNPDGTYDYDGDLILNNFEIDSLLDIPIRFRNVYGEFDCSLNNLISLVGCPESVVDFNCSNNLLISLQYAPKEVGGHFSCSSNCLLSKEHKSKFNDEFRFDYNPFEIIGYVIETVKAMTHEQQMSELKFFDENDPKASKMLQEILFDLGVDFGTHRKEIFGLAKEKDLGHLGL